MTDSSIPSAIADTTTPRVERPSTGQRTRLDPKWDEYSAQYLQRHPEISAAVPSWAEEIDFSTIEDELEGTIFSFSKSIGEVELYGVGKMLQSGTVQLAEGGRPNIYLPDEIACQKVGDIAQEMLDLAQDLISAASLLRAEPRLLRRPAEVDAELQRLDI
jgi:hypothetical protein